jgi:glucans biosynthesis protein
MIGKVSSALAPKRHSLSRRSLLATVASLSAAAGLGGVSSAFAQPSPGLDDPNHPFGRSDVLALARRLAKDPYQPPSTDLPEPFNSLTYEQYQDIRFRPERSVWADQKLPFQLQMLMRSAPYNRALTSLSVVEDGRQLPITYSPDQFDFGSSIPAPVPEGDIGFSGFRIHYPLNAADRMENFVSFQGNSYFHARAKGQTIGLSGRALAIRTASPDGEEFPVFRQFWVEKPRQNGSVIVVHALLDSKSVTGAYRFTIRPGAETVMDVEMTLFPRVDLKEVGLAPSSSMYFFGELAHEDVDDYRPAVSDSDGLLMLNGLGEVLWRPLSNPRDLQISAFQDQGPRGFGLMQRNRRFSHYQDLEQHYESRPSLWIEPIGDWSSGTVTLVEIPSGSEFNDNIVAFWRPSAPLPAGTEASFSYRLRWCDDFKTDRARVIASRSGLTREGKSRLFVIDYEPLPGDNDTAPEIGLTTSAGKISNGRVQRNSDTNGWRVSFELNLNGVDMAELRCDLKRGDTPVGESWLYRWTPPK